MNAQEKETLRYVHKEVIETVDLKGTLILDELVQNDILELHERELILSKLTRKNQTSRLLYILKRRGPDKKPYKGFRQSLLKEYSPIVAQMDSIYAQNSYLSDLDICLFCFIRQNVIASDICHKLYQDAVISDNENEAILDNSVRNNREDVERILKRMLRLCVNDQIVAHEQFLSALQAQYKYIHDRIERCKIEEYSKCLCANVNAKIDEDDEPLLDLNEGQPSNVLQIVNNNNQGKLSTMHDAKWRILIWKISMTMFKDPYFIDTGIINLQRKYSAIWNTLFRLREECNWKEYMMYKKQLHLLYPNDADVQTMIYRSDMSISGYFQKNPEKAKQLYHSAKELLPGTTMYYWHLVRLISLEAFNLIQNNQLPAADECLTNAKETLNSLVPPMPRGMVTAIIPYMRGKYYWKMYRFGRRNKQAADLVYSCFEEAIREYEKEEVFKVSKFVSQIFAFMALCSLQVDISPRIGPSLPRGVIEISDEDIERAENALRRMREEQYWAERTKWSEMLYYVARGELSLLRGDVDLQESLAQFQEALSMAQEYKFTLYVQHAEDRIKFILGQCHRQN